MPVRFPLLWARLIFGGVTSAVAQLPGCRYASNPQPQSYSLMPDPFEPLSEAPLVCLWEVLSDPLCDVAALPCGEESGLWKDPDARVSGDWVFDRFRPGSGTPCKSCIDESFNA